MFTLAFLPDIPDDFPWLPLYFSHPLSSIFYYICSMKAGVFILFLLVIAGVCIRLFPFTEIHTPPETSICKPVASPDTHASHHPFLFSDPLSQHIKIREQRKTGTGLAGQWQVVGSKNYYYQNPSISFYSRGLGMSILLLFPKHHFW